MSALFSGLAAFPLTPADASGVVDLNTLSVMIDRLASAKVDAIGLLGSTGTYAYLDRSERKRAVAAALEAASGRTPVIVGIGALRTSWAQELAADAERAGAAGLLMAPMSYTPLTLAEAAHHYRTVAATTGLPLCVYNNPGTTHFVFSDDLIAELATVPNIASIKMPLPVGEDAASQLARLRGRVSADFRIGYGGDWGAADAMLAGADAWYSVVAGLLPKPALALMRAAQAGDTAEVRRLDGVFSPLWALFKAHGSIRVVYAIADQLRLRVGEPPPPLRRIDATAANTIAATLDGLMEATA